MKKTGAKFMVVLIALMEWKSTGMYMHVVYAVIIALSVAQIATTITKKQ